MLEKLGLRKPGLYIAVLWNPGGQPLILERNITNRYARELDYMDNSPDE